ncbi:MAG TPA: type II toxin-antitoxin system RelE/ParE family toxin [Dehalococcoidia bacterium]|nr:type II toxin-antitoxin system RelE/ParE family toxin [Dehalococcoidia bacterium]
MASVTWSATAEADFEALVRFIARDSTVAADSLRRSVLHSVRRLEDFPRAGTVVPKLERSEVREIIVGNYRVIDRLSEDQVLILTFQHGALRLRLDPP